MCPAACARISGGMRKPAHVIEKERRRKASARETIWLFGLHAVAAALVNPRRERLRLIATRNALERLGELHGMAPEIADARSFPAPLDPGSVHQGAALEVRPLDQPALDEVADGRPLLMLDRVSDPHNVGAILRSAEVFGAAAVIAPARHSAPETGALAKTASDALERMPYLRPVNLSEAMRRAQALGYECVGLAGESEEEIGAALAPGRPVALVMGAEGPGLRQLTRETCDRLARIGPAGGATGGFASLNVSNAAAVALYAVARR